jgi:N-acetylglucosaminyldiphosphoundecaprenol N-acetyl-beta-D-mannosaminyltransferase
MKEKIGDLRTGPACEACSQGRSRVVVNGVGFDPLTTTDEFDAQVHKFVACGASHVVHFLSAHPTVIARDVSAYRELLGNGDLVVADGAPIALSMRLRGCPAIRVTGTDGFDRVCRNGISNALRHYFVGCPDSETASIFEEEVRRRHPGIVICGIVVPPFRSYTEPELAQLAAEISRSRADVVWIGTGTPKQDVLAHRLRLLSVAPVIASIGAVFDFVAGTKARAPRFIRMLGMEWLFRFVLEPRRLWYRYLIGNSRFVGGVVADALKSGLAANPALAVRGRDRKRRRPT